MPEYDKDLQSIQEARLVIDSAKKAQQELALMDQEQINRIVENMVNKAVENAEYLAELAHNETGFGKKSDKIIKNKFASQTLYESIKDLKTVGLLHDDKENKVLDVAVPVGVVAGLIPSTNPTSTTIYKAIIALKSGNSIVFSPHPGAKQAILATVEILQKAALEAGAPQGVIASLSILSKEGTAELMKHKDVALILATGGEAMVRAAYSSGTPAIGVGPGNGPAFIERTADIEKAVTDIITSKTFDNGVICASEQSIVVETIIEQQVIEELKRQKAYFLTDEQSLQLARFILRANGTINPQIVGKTAIKIAEMAGFSVPSDTTVLISRQTNSDADNPYAREKLCPILAFYSERDWIAACNRSIALLTVEGKGHTLCIHTNDEQVIKEFALKKPVSRMLVNTPGALGGIGGTTNLAPALTLGCGAVGGSSTSDNITPMHLLNVRRVAYGTRTVQDIIAGFDLTSCTENKEEKMETSMSDKLPLSDEEIQQLLKLAVEKLSAV
ncbi:acetaldehyde dehydrogenase (acetylating) [Amphibacillus sp. Q70]|uniref:acetaldehyde dehydrogenase (acetylating) n=1 Tax=Amphibacillus sp. Q70 TaxID=3453416 RepID=UPI003F848271